MTRLRKTTNCGNVVVLYEFINCASERSSTLKDAYLSIAKLATIFIRPFCELFAVEHLDIELRSSVVHVLMKCMQQASVEQ